MNFYGPLEWLFKSESARVKFENLLKVAHDINAINPLALYDFINLILKPMQSELNLITVELGTGAAKPVGLKDLFTEKMEPYLYEFSRAPINSSDRKLKINCDIAFTRPWNRQRYIDNLCYLSSRNPNREPVVWQEDSNHYVTLILPWRFFLVGTGNHSIMAGIATGRGEVSPQEVEDVSLLLSKFHTNGKYWFDSKTNKKVDRVNNYRGAAVFEIGRVLSS
ncbi:DUF6710 family protein [Vibrio splendidus]|uniref:DUF6710 family protein n=1 Tax=Vibrio splendidus TaxID=29497 RepID=UPI00352EBDC1